MKDYQNLHTENYNYTDSSKECPMCHEVFLVRCDCPLCTNLIPQCPRCAGNVVPAAGEATDAEVEAMMAVTRNRDERKNDED